MIASPDPIEVRSKSNAIRKLVAEHEVIFVNAVIGITAASIPVKGHGVVIAHSEITERKRMDELDREQRAELAHVSRLNIMQEMTEILAQPQQDQQISQ